MNEDKKARKDRINIFACAVIILIMLALGFGGPLKFMAVNGLGTQGCAIMLTLLSVIPGMAITKWLFPDWLT